MRHPRPRIGKNATGWYVALPTAYGSWDVIDNLPSHSAAHHVLDHLDRYYRGPYILV